MNQKRLVSFLMVAAVAGVVACSSGESQSVATDNNTQTTEETATTSTGAANPKGIGKYQNVDLTHPVDETMVAQGKNVYEVKCASCHKVTEEKLVGPGLAKVTDRRTPEWIMNFVTNTEEMIDKDAAAQKLLEEHLVRMPNQNLSEQDARAVLEFMRKNDGKN
jgi:mono/diheme cytochrome c family protein